MAYVPPNSIIKLLAGVPIDSSFDHTLWFESANAQYTYFNSKAVRTFSNVSYTRKGRGYIKVEAPADQLYACNYMMFQNTSYSNKWFYAFCQIEYVNDTTSAVYFTIDPLQTWFFEMQLGQCYVEREHATHDVAGDNLIPEGLETGEYIYEDNDYDWCYEFTSYDVVIYTSFASSWNGSEWVFDRNSQGRYMWGVYSGLNMRLFQQIEVQATIDNINSFITQATQEGLSDGIVAIVMSPHVALDNNLDPTQILHTIPKITSLDGYTPKNKKLLTAPYCFIEANNCEGAVAVLPQEYFGGQTPAYASFMITFNITTAPVAVCVPLNYKGSEYALTEALYINNFTQCSYNTDLFKAYMAQSLTAKLGDMLVDTIGEVGNNVDASGAKEIPPEGTSARRAYEYQQRTGRDPTFPGNSSRFDTHDIGTIGGYLGAGAIETLATGGRLLPSIYADLSQLYAKSVQAPHNSGGNTPDYLTSNRLKGFWFFHRTIRYEYAKIIDDYFSRFGYACHQIKVPNIHARTEWTYTKTLGCQIHGNLPADAIVAIQAIFDRGITFWADPTNFGNYSLNNDIILTPVTP